MQSNDQSKLLGNVVSAIFSAAAVAAASILGQIATYPNLTPWYTTLNKPPFNPPSWVFAPVWTALYLLMAFALWRILRISRATRGRSVALILFFIQLVLNAAWSWMFFAANSPVLGLANIVPQFLVIVAAVIAFHRLDRMAGSCLVPLAVWVAFASVLNFAIWRLNA